MDARKITLNPCFPSNLVLYFSYCRSVKIEPKEIKTESCVVW